MKVITTKTQIILTKKEKETLEKARNLLDEIAEVFCEKEHYEPEYEETFAWLEEDDQWSDCIELIIDCTKGDA